MEVSQVVSGHQAEVEGQMSQQDVMVDSLAPCLVNIFMDSHCIVCKPDTCYLFYIHFVQYY